LNLYFYAELNCFICLTSLTVFFLYCSFLLDRLLQYEKLDDSSGDSDLTASSDSESESFKTETTSGKRYITLIVNQIFIISPPSEIILESQDSRACDWSIGKRSWLFNAFHSFQVF